MSDSMRNVGECPRCWLPSGHAGPCDEPIADRRVTAEDLAIRIASSTTGQELLDAIYVALLTFPHPPKELQMIARPSRERGVSQRAWDLATPKETP